jgi:PKD repeat protein
MRFILDDNGIPSVAQFIQLLPLDQIEPPAANFTSSSPDVLGGITQFTNASTGAGLIYTWDFGDGSPVSNQANPVHTYTAVGNYTVTLTATNPAGSDTVIGSVEITPWRSFLPVILNSDD